MSSNPDMVGGPDRFDTLLMQAAGGRIASKGGAEGYQGIALRPGALGPGSPALGIAIKISDGDQGGRAVSLAAMTVLRRLGALDALGADACRALEKFDRRVLRNWRELEIGEIRPAREFELEFETVLDQDVASSSL